MTDDLVKKYRNMQAALGGGCSDGYCVIENTKGMHTNGGCSCLSNLGFMEMQRVGAMLRIAQAMADHIQDIEAKLAKATDVLREILFYSNTDDIVGWLDALARAQALMTELEN